MEPLLFQIWDVARQLLRIEKDFDKLIDSVKNEELSKEELLKKLTDLRGKYFPIKEN